MSFLHVFTGWRFDQLNLALCHISFIVNIKGSITFAQETATGVTYLF